MEPIMAMKCVKNALTNEIFRMPEDTAEIFVSVGYGSYASKREWKDQGRLYWAREDARNRNKNLRKARKAQNTRNRGDAAGKQAARME
jgi:hypothetical protein